MEHLSWDEIWAYVDATMMDAAETSTRVPDASTKAYSHILQCPTCAQKLRTAQTASGLLAQRLQIPDIDTAFDADHRLLQALSNSPRVADAVRRSDGIATGKGRASGTDGASGTGRRRVVRTRNYAFMGAAAALVVVAWTGTLLMRDGHSENATSTASSTDSPAVTAKQASVAESTQGSVSGSATGSEVGSTVGSAAGTSSSPTEVLAPKHGASLNGSAGNEGAAQNQVADSAGTKSASTETDMSFNVLVQGADGVPLPGARVAFAAQGQILASGTTKSDGRTGLLQISTPSTPSGTSSSVPPNAQQADVAMIVWEDGFQPLVSYGVGTWAGTKGSTITATLQPSPYSDIQVLPDPSGTATPSQSDAWRLYQWASQQVH